MVSIVACEQYLRLPALSPGCPKAAMASTYIDIHPRSAWGLKLDESHQDMTDYLGKVEIHVPA